MRHRSLAMWIYPLLACFLAVLGCSRQQESSSSSLSGVDEQPNACTLSELTVPLLNPAARFERSKGKPVTETLNFSVPMDGELCVVVYNGDGDPPHGQRVSAAWVSIDGELVIGPDPFDQNTAEIRAPHSVSAGDHELSVRLASKPGSFLTVQLTFIAGEKAPPDLTVAEDQLVTDLDTLSFHVEITDESAIDTGSFQAFLEGTDVSEHFSVTQSTAVSEPISLPNIGNNVITVRVSDIFGNTGETTAHIYRGETGYLPDAYEVIGENGGVIEVTDPSSPIFGTSVTIPEGAFEEDTGISIGIKREPPPIVDFFRVGPIVDIQPDGLHLNSPVILALPFDESKLPPLYSVNETAVYHFDTSGEDWNRLGGHIENNFVVSSISSFSPYCPGVILIPLCDNLFSEVDYDGCRLPDDPLQDNPWELDEESEGNPYIVNCELVIPVEEQFGFHAYRRFDGALIGASGYMMEARVRVDSYYQPGGTMVNAVFAIYDGLKAAYIRLHHRYDGSTLAIAHHYQGSGHVDIDTSNYHTYKIEVSRGGMARFYVDGMIFHEVPYEQLNEYNVPPHLAVFGGEESTTYWDNIHYVVGDVEPFTWLSNNPNVADKLLWEDELGISTWQDWSPDLKEQLRIAFHKSRCWMSWFAGGMSGDEPVPVDVENPPPNVLYNDDPTEWVDMMLSPDDAWKLYIAHLAWSLLVEIDNDVYFNYEWSLTDFIPSSLEEVLSGNKMFTFRTNPQIGYGFEWEIGSVVPAPPAYIYKELGHLISTTTMDNVVSNLLRFGQDNMLHWSAGLGGNYYFWNFWNHWQYYGFPPISKMIEGTTCVRHSQGLQTCAPGVTAAWTYGCGGAASFLREILRIFNIPAIPTSYNAGHTQSFFSELFISELSMYLSSGDDFFMKIAKYTFMPAPWSIPPYIKVRIPSSELLIDEETYRLWFGYSGDPRNICEEVKRRNTLRRTFEIGIDYLSTWLMKEYCDDVRDGYIVGDTIVDTQNSDIFEHINLLIERPDPAQYPTCQSPQDYGIDPLISDWGVFLSQMRQKAEAVCTDDIVCGCNAIRSIQYPAPFEDW